MLYGYGILNNHAPTLKATAMRGGATLSPYLTSLYAVYKGESNANDSLGTYNGTAQGGLTYSAGKSGNCFVPNGTNGYVSLPNNALNGLGQTFTIAVWFNPSSANSGYHTILSTVDSGFAYGWELDSYVDGTALTFQLYNTTQVNLTAGIGAISRSAWSLILIERVSGTSTKMYVNNTLVASNTSSVDARYGATMYASLGALKYGASNVGQYLSANYNYDEVAFYSRALTTQEKTDFYNSGAGKFYPTF
jgi:hypothetical protein